MTKRFLEDYKENCEKDKNNLRAMDKSWKRKEGFRLASDLQNENCEDWWAGPWIDMNRRAIEAYVAYWYEHTHKKKTAAATVGSKDSQVAPSVVASKDG